MKLTTLFLLVCASVAQGASFIYNVTNGEIYGPPETVATFSPLVITSKNGWTYKGVNAAVGMSGEYSDQENVSQIQDFTTITIAEYEAYRNSIIAQLVASTLAIADYYGVTSRPVDWLALDVAIEAASEVPETEAKAVIDAIRLNKNTMFLKEWGVDLFNVGAE